MMFFNYKIPQYVREYLGLLFNRERLGNLAEGLNEGLTTYWADSYAIDFEPTGDIKTNQEYYFTLGRQYLRYRANINGSQFSLQNSLNDLFDFAQRRIRILNIARQESKIYTGFESESDNEPTPVFTGFENEDSNGTAGIYIGANAGDKVNERFIIALPNDPAVTDREEEIRAWIERYRAAGKNYYTIEISN